MKKLLLLPIILLTLTALHAQQDPQFSQYMFNQLYLSPAAAGINAEDIEFTVIHRSQWLGYSPSFDDGGAPTTQVASASMPLTKYNLGLGLNMVNDQLGAETNQTFRLSLAYQLKLKKGVLALGVSGGMYNYSIDFDKLRFVDPDDPFNNQSGKQSQFTPDFSAGLYFKPNNNKFYLGVGVNHLNEAEFTFDTDEGYNTLKQHLNIFGGVNLDLSRTVVLTPSFIVKSDMNVFSFEASAIATFNQKIYAGLSMRELESAIALVGLHLLKDNKLRVGYAFDYTLEARNAKETTSHEILLTYRLKAFTPFQPSIIRTPRFRHE
ncbi:type IX secretion system membrane protein PorP/SprF [Flammeovirgaceae bacterium SG7u.111]|nr:type IX secretion system membrane protein PorP/SprF [Flammeovirgaceae bacterium SG7u.132]WPO36390.1 type IX secretion system membrane protein PorP/SprF [Flammeovirgaceae bacterium SG7u.111]